MRAVVVLCLSLLFAHTAAASVVINEIAWMGTTDSSSNEWIELANDGSAGVDLSGWVLRIEGKKDIALTGSLAAHGYYLIERTDDSTVPGVSGDLITSFSTGLSNDGATLLLLNAGGQEVDRVVGSDGWKIGGEQAGNNTTKETAQRGDSVWGTAVPTPRAVNAGISSSPTVSPAPSSSHTNTSSTVSDFPVEPQIFASVGSRTRTTFAGAPTRFTGRVVGINKEPIENARMIWAFGDGATTSGGDVSHVFYYPGDYTVILDAASGHYAASDRALISVLAPSIVVLSGGTNERSFVSLENNSSAELDLSGWQILGGGKTFVLPEHTLVGAHKKVLFAGEVTGLVTPETTFVELRFPNGIPVPAPGAGASVSPQMALVSQISSYRESSPVSYVEKKEPVIQQVSGAIESIVLGEEEPQDSQKGWWYSGLFLASALVLLALRYTRSSRTDSEDDVGAEDFDIIEE